MEHTYISICEHLRSKLAELKHVDLFNDQKNK